MQSRPMVSVLIPTYNYGHLLDVTIRSVLSQTYSNYELIIVDNASTDNTKAVVGEYLGDRRIRYHRNVSNIGLAGNWNKCLEYATGKYIKFLCADDKFHPEILERYVSILERNPSISVVTSKKQWFGKNVPNKIISVPYHGKCNGQEAISWTIKTNFNYIGEPSLPMFRSENFVNERFEDLKYVTDWEMWVRQLLKGDCYVIPEVLCYVRRHDSQQQVQMKKLAVNYYEMYKLYKDMDACKYGVSFTDVSEELKELIRLYALKCAFGFYRALPEVSNRQLRPVISRLGKVALSEFTIFHPGLVKLFLEKIRERKAVKSKVESIDDQYSPLYQSNSHHVLTIMEKNNP